MSACITLDESNAEDQEVLEHAFSERALKSFLHIGYQLYKHAVFDKLHGIVDENIESVVSTRLAAQEIERNMQIDSLKTENLVLVKKIEECSQEVWKKCELDIEKKKLTITHLEGLLADAHIKNKALEQKVSEIYNEVFKDSVYQLKETIKQREMEISMLKNTNMVKGRVGEDILMKTLKNIFTDCEVTNMSKTSHVCDVHLVFPPGNKKMVFESKYKGSVDKKDVEKFQGDVQGMGTDVIGGVFVSFLCKNIPNKGSINFEIMSNNRKALMYMAFENEEEFNMFFPHHIVMFCKLCESLRDHTVDTAVLDQTLDEIRFVCQNLNKNKKRLEELKSSFNKYYTEVDDDNKVLLERLDAIIKNTIPKKRIMTTKVHICSQCGFTCSSRKALNAHAKDVH